jgi:signal peptidase I
MWRWLAGAVFISFINPAAADADIADQFMACMAKPEQDQRVICYERIRKAIAAQHAEDQFRPKIKTYSMSASSMVPTLLAGDLIISQTQYYTSHEPQRGDVAIFKLPTDNSIEYIKRIVGLPGDRIQMRHGNLYINDQLAARRPIEDYVYHEGGSLMLLHQYLEDLPRKSGEPPLEHRIVKIGDDGPLDNTPVYEVPPGHYFTLGDSRDNSQDSRVLSAVGFIPRKNLIGRADVVFWPLNRLGIEIQ